MKYFLLFILASLNFLFTTGIVISSAGRQSNLQLCPPGGQSFQNALYLVCGFNRKVAYGYQSEVVGWEAKRQQIESKCCTSGCDFMTLAELCFINE